MLIKLGSNQSCILKSLLETELDRLKPKIKNNRLYKRDYSIIRGIYDKLRGRRRVCSKCGQEVKRGKS